MAQNKMSDGRMFKIDFDPRVIGNKILPDGTRKTGIGEFIRKTSLDEFPQFWNVLNGTMSLVGTRPILQDELQKYELHHRARIAIKPGITGMWQVSGRSDITDFEEVVRLDTEYIAMLLANNFPQPFPDAHRNEEPENGGGNNDADLPPEREEAPSEYENDGNTATIGYGELKTLGAESRYEEIKMLNGMKDNVLSVGFVLLIP